MLLAGENESGERVHTRGNGAIKREKLQKSFNFIDEFLRSQMGEEDK
jgi:hypothetical protein